MLIPWAVTRSYQGNCWTIILVLQSYWDIECTSKMQSKNANILLTLPSEYLLQEDGSSLTFAAIHFKKSMDTPCMLWYIPYIQFTELQSQSCLVRYGMLVCYRRRYVPRHGIPHRPAGGTLNLIFSPSFVRTEIAICRDWRFMQTFVGWRRRRCVKMKCQHVMFPKPNRHHRKLEETLSKRIQIVIWQV